MVFRSAWNAEEISLRLNAEAGFSKHPTGLQDVTDLADIRKLALDLEA